MKLRQQASPAALELIERFEGFRRTAARLDDGRWTIGYGHTKFARAGAEISTDDAETFLLYDLRPVTDALNEWVHTPLTQNQFDALAAFVFNIGVDNFRHSSVLRRINEGQLLQAACAMEMWRRADFEGERIIIDALVRRRAAEKTLFLTPTDGFRPAPTPVLNPQLDGELTGVIPAHKPVEVSAPLEGVRAIAERIGPLEDYRPLRAEPEERPTASQAAAEAVISRLQAITPEDFAPEPPAAIEPALEPEPEPEPEPELEIASFGPISAPEPRFDDAPGFTLTPPAPENGFAEAALEGAAPAASDAAEDSATLFSSEPLGFDEFDSQRVAHHEFDVMSEIDQTPVESLRGINPVVLWLGMVILGLVVFAAGIFWGFSAKQASGGGVFSVHVLVGWGLGIVGIGCVATAVYFLLERLGGREEQ